MAYSMSFSASRYSTDRLVVPLLVEVHVAQVHLALGERRPQLERLLVRADRLLRPPERRVQQHALRVVRLGEVGVER